MQGHIDCRPLASQFAEQLLRVGVQLCPVPLRIQIDLGQAVTGLHREALRILLQISLQLLIRRLGNGDHIFGYEFEFLAQSPPDDGVVLVKPQPFCFPIVDPRALNPRSGIELRLVRMRWLMRR